MTATLQEAIAVARGGDRERALMLAADVAQRNPDDPNAWYLLSQLVESDTRRAVYLGKTLALDPTHPRARVEFDSLSEELSSAVTPIVTPSATPAGSTESVPEPALETENALPEWLRPLSPEPVPVTPTTSPPTQETPVTSTAAPKRKPKKTPPPPPPRKKGNQALTILLVLLAVLTMAVLAFLMYLLLV